MTLLFDTQKKEWLDAPEEQVGSLVGSGQYSFRQGVRIPVVLPDGTRGTVDPVDAVQVFRDGGTYETGSMAKRRADESIQEARAEAFDKPAIALLAGAARGATFGATDVLTRALGGEDLTEGLQTLRETSPIASTIGEVAGGLVGPAAGIAGAAGRAVSGAVGATTAAGRIGAGALGAATEGLMYSAGEIASQAALSDPKLTAQNAALTLGLGTVLGGGIGALTKGTSEGYQKLQDILQTTVADSALPGKAADTLGRGLAKLTSIVRALPEEDAARLKNLYTTDAQKMLRYAQNPQELEKDAVKALTDIYETGKSLSETVIGLRNQYQKALSVELDEASNKAARELLSSMDRSIRIAKAKKNLVDQGAVKRAVDIRNQLERKITRGDKPAQQIPEKVVKPEIPEFVGEGALIDDVRTIPARVEPAQPALKNKRQLHEAVEEAKKMWGNTVMSFGEEVPKGVAQNTERIFEKTWGNLKKHLTDESLYGEFAKKYADINAAENIYLTYKGIFDKQFIQRVPNLQGRMEDRIKLGPALDVVRNPEKMQSLEKLAKLDDLSAAIKNLSKQAEDVGPLPLDALQKSLDAIENVKDVRSNLLMLSYLESPTGKSKYGLGMGVLGGAALGSFTGFGAAPLALAGGALGSLAANPRTALRYLVRIQNLGKQGTEKIQDNLSTMLGVSRKVGGKVTSRMADVAPRVGVMGLLQSLGDDAEAAGGTEVDRLRDTLERHMENPQIIDDYFVRANPQLDNVSPAVGAELRNTTMRALQHVSGLLPPRNPAALFGTPPTLSRYQRDKLEASIDAAFRPMRALEEMASKNPDPAAIAAVSVVYPDLYAQMQKTAFELATEKGTDLSYRERLALGKAFKLPTVPSLAQIQQIQDMYKMTTQGDLEQAAGKKLDVQGISTPAMTEVQRLAI